MNLMPLIIGGGLLAGGYFLFATEAGQDLIASITNPQQKEEREKWKDPFKYLSPATADAWNPESKMYKDIQKRIYKKSQLIQDYYDY